MQEYYNKEEQFLSTPSARRATASSGRPAKTTAYFYPRPPRGGRRISFIMSRLFLKFLSTPSARRATALLADANMTQKISIHALREEGDAQSAGRTAAAGNFYPRPPRGGRRIGQA